MIEGAVIFLLVMNFYLVFEVSRLKHLQSMDRKFMMMTGDAFAKFAISIANIFESKPKEPDTLEMRR
jgi:hypothetical protein